MFFFYINFFENFFREYQQCQSVRIQIGLEVISNDAGWQRARLHVLCQTEKTMMKQHINQHFFRISIECSDKATFYLSFLKYTKSLKC